MKNLKNLYGIFEKSYQLLPDYAKQKYRKLVIAQLLVSFLDILAIAIIGYIGVYTTSSDPKLPLFIHKVFSVIGQTIENKNTVFIILAFLGTTILILRTLISTYFSLKILKFLSLQSGKFSNEIISKYFRGSVDQIRKFKQQEFIYIATAATDDWAIRILGGFSFLISETFLMVIVSITLISIRPIVFLISSIYFSLIILFFYFKSLKPRQELGNSIVKESIFIQENMELMYKHYRELKNFGTLGFFENLSSQSRIKRQMAMAELSFMPGLSKYVLEIGVVLGALLLGSFQLLFMSPERAIGNFAIFFLAAARVAPALMRLQQYSFGIKSVENATERILDFTLKLDQEREAAMFELGNLSESQLLLVSNLHFKFNNSNVDLLNGINFGINKGQKIALIGATGSGKSTLLDCLLGFRRITAGSIQFNENLVDKKKVLNMTCYVPQDVGLINGTIRDNLLFGASDLATDQELLECARNFGLAESLKIQDSSLLDTEIGQTGLKLSGGQMQRIGLIRAYLRRPALLILDEPTSALDGISEMKMFDAIDRNTWGMSLLVTAHRLSTIKDSDCILLLKNGVIAEKGTYSELLQDSYEFKLQLQALGIEN